MTKPGHTSSLKREGEGEGGSERKREGGEGGREKNVNTHYQVVQISLTCVERWCLRPWDYNNDDQSVSFLT